MILTASLRSEKWVPLVEAPSCYAWRGLIRRYSWCQVRRCKPEIPFGWKYAHEPDYGSLLVMPVWVYPLYVAKRDWYRWVYEPLIRWGFWRLGENDYYNQGHWQWAFWREAA